MNKLVYIGHKSLEKYNFTYGKVYDVIRESYYLNVVISDNNQECNVKYSHFFIPLEEWRNKKIAKVLDTSLETNHNQYE